MNNIIWRKIKIGDLFERSTQMALSEKQKNINLVDEKDSEHSIALISSSRNGSGRVGYLNNTVVPLENVSINKLTFDDQWGFTFFQQEEFIITGGHNAILEVKNDTLKKLLDANLSCYSFLSLIINKITIKSGLFGYGYKINNKLDREIILLPCLKCSQKDSIWEENGSFYTLAVDYIEILMKKAKELREQKTIHKYEAERAKYEAERAKYEAEYLKEKSILSWKSFKLENLFIESTEHYLKKSKKNYNISEYKDLEHQVAVCAASKYNNGIVGYISEIDDVPLKKRKGFITKGGFGHFFYQEDWFIKPGGSWGMLNIIKCKDDKFKSLLDKNILTYKFISKLLTNIFTPFMSYGYSAPFDREIILLPCLECSQNDSVWEENGKFYTLAINYISYLYLSGRVNYYQKLIDNYEYQY